MEKTQVFLGISILIVIIIGIVMLKHHKSSSNSKENMKLVRGSQLPPVVDATYQCPSGTVNISTAIGGEFPCISTTPNGSVSDCYNNCNAGNWYNGAGNPLLDCKSSCLEQLDRLKVPHCNSPCVYPNVCSPKSLTCVSVVNN